MCCVFVCVCVGGRVCASDIVGCSAQQRAIFLFYVRSWTSAYGCGGSAAFMAHLTGQIPLQRAGERIAQEEDGRWRRNARALCSSSSAPTTNPYCVASLEKTINTKQKRFLSAAIGFLWMCFSHSRRTYSICHIQRSILTSFTTPHTHTHQCLCTEHQTHTHTYSIVKVEHRYATEFGSS